MESCFQHLGYRGGGGGGGGSMVKNTGGLVREFEVWDFDWEKVFWVFFKNIDLDNS